MPKAAVLQSAFNAGELSPLMYGRTDSPRYKQGLATNLNYIPTLQGPIQRRPGTKFMNAAKDSTKPPILIPFVFSESQAYMLEFGDKYIRFYFDNGQVLTSGTTYKVSIETGWGGWIYASRSNNAFTTNQNVITTSTITNGSILEIQTPYSYTDLTTLRFTQNADSLYLFHPNYPVFKLQNFGASLWDLTQVYFQDGPYLELNSYSSNADSTGINLTPLTDTAPICEINSTYASPPVITGIIADPALGIEAEIECSAGHGLSTGDQVFISGVGGAVQVNNYDWVTEMGGIPGNVGNPPFWVITVTSTTNFLLNGSLFVDAYTSGGTIFPALFASDMTAQIAVTQMPDMGRNIALEISGVRYWGTIGNGFSPISFRNASRAYVCGPNYVAAFGEIGTPATAWQMSPYSYTNGFPSCGAFHQDRLFLSGVQAFPG
jgi:hypothetical protein